MKSLESTLFRKFGDIKDSQHLVYYDTHIHPHDVFGLCADCKSKNRKADPSLLERLKYADGVLKVLAFLFLYFPSYIRGQIRQKFPYSEETILQEMEAALIDKATIVPISPDASPEIIYQKFISKDFIRLGSIDIQNIDIGEIQKTIESQITKYSICGLKLHPNIQKFYPEPSLNTKEIEDKLKSLYKIIEEKNLYLLIHGGISYVPLGSNFEKREFGLIENFFDKDEISFISKLKIPVVIAHLGLYNVKNPSFIKINKIALYENVYFDTAGINPDLIIKFIKNNGIEKLIFGSDAPYFDLKYNIGLVLKAIHTLKDINFENSVSKIFSLNYERILKYVRYN